MANTSLDAVVQQVRRILQDETTPYRYDDERIVANLNTGLAAILRIRPDIIALQEHNTRYSGSDIGKGVNLPINIQYSEPLILFCTALTELADDEFSVDGRVVALDNKFRQQLTMGG